ncbi:MAG TPA: PEGA domain-containing protein [Polyangiaceae bacterium]|nr:PEGA domain-containing protein [Polyangiaceae bacterium]
MSIRFPLLVSLAIASHSAIAFAEPPAPAPSANATTEARERFQRGVALYREGSFDAALAEFRRAYEIAPNYRILYNLAQVQVERHDSVAALSLFGQYLQQGGNEIDAERRAQVERDMQSLRGRVADLTVESNVSGAQLTIDGIEAGTLPLAGPVQVNSGVRQITLSKPGYQSVSRSVTIAGAQPLKLNLNLEPADARAAEGTAAAAAGGTSTGKNTKSDQSHGLSTPFWISAVATGVFTGAAVTFGVVSLNRNQKLDDELNRYPSDPQAIDDARHSLKTSALLTDVFTGAAIVGAAASVYFAITSSNSEAPPAKSAAKSARKERLQLGVGGSQLILSGRF